MIQELRKEKLAQYVELFISAFNKAPWNDEWTVETATKRLEQMMNNPQCFGMDYEVEGKVVGVILGRQEQYYNGVHFQVQEFFVDDTMQGKGIGSTLLKVFTETLEARGINRVYLLTCPGEQTEGFYNRKGFITDKESICCVKDL